MFSLGQGKNPSSVVGSFFKHRQVCVSGPSSLEKFIDISIKLDHILLKFLWLFSAGPLPTPIAHANSIATHTSRVRLTLVYKRLWPRTRYNKTRFFRRTRWLLLQRVLSLYKNMATSTPPSKKRKIGSENRGFNPDWQAYYVERGGQPLSSVWRLLAWWRSTTSSATSRRDIRNSLQ